MERGLCGEVGGVVFCAGLEKKGLSWMIGGFFSIMACQLLWGMV